MVKNSKLINKLGAVILPSMLFFADPTSSVKAQEKTNLPLVRAVPLEYAEFEKEILSMRKGFYFERDFLELSKKYPSRHENILTENLGDYRINIPLIIGDSSLSIWYSYSVEKKRGKLNAECNLMQYKGRAKDFGGNTRNFGFDLGMKVNSKSISVEGEIKF